MTDGSSFAKLTDAEGKQDEDGRRGMEQGKPIGLFSHISLGLTTSCVDSGIGGTVSMHSDLSALCQSPIYPVRGTHYSNTR